MDIAAIDNEDETKNGQETFRAKAFWAKTR